MKKILLLGSGELGKEFTIAAKRAGQYFIACDKYAGAPAMQVADTCEVFDMLDGEAMAGAVKKHDPDIIVPEIETIRTERLYDFERQGIHVVPSAGAANFTMNRDVKEIIIEEFIHFISEFTLLTVTQKNGPTLFCPPVGHVQVGGDYHESWQPYTISPEALEKAQQMAGRETVSLSGAGILGVDFFLCEGDDVYFSELSPRPHDTGMITLGHTTNLSEFELRFRAVMGWPIPAIHLEHAGASAVILAPKEGWQLSEEAIAEVLKEDKVRVRIIATAMPPTATAWTVSTPP